MIHPFSGGIPNSFLGQIGCTTECNQKFTVTKNNYGPPRISPYYLAGPHGPNVTQKPMFSWIFAFFQKNRPSGGAVWRYDFHAGAWLRQTPAFACARHRGSPAFACAGHRGFMATPYLHHIFDKYTVYIKLKVILPLETALFCYISKGKSLEARSYFL